MTDDIVQNEYMFVIFLNIADLLSGLIILYVKKWSKSKVREQSRLSSIGKLRSYTVSIFNKNDKLLKKKFLQN